VVKCQAIDIVEVLFSLRWRRTIVETSCRHRKSRYEPLSPLQAHRSTTKSGGVWDFPIFASLPGAGPVHASRLISALGTDRKRYEHAEDLLTFTGIAPIMARSGKTTMTHFRWCCPTCLRQSFHEFAGQSIQHSQWAKAFDRQQRRRGKDHQAAVRSLAFKWVRIIFQLWKNRTPYHERTYVTA
jgi:Transposase IS116/IS110/IS902 family